MAHEDNPWSQEAADDKSKMRQSDVLKMKWTQGDHNIRILPSKSNEGLPFVKYIVHWVPVKTAKNDRPIIHAVDFKCPVCEFVSQIWSEIYRLKEEDEMTDKSPEVKKLMAQAGKLKGKKTFDMNILDRDDYFDEKDKTKIKIKRLVAGPTVWKPIVELGNSTKWGNPSAGGKKGYDLTVTVDGEGLKREYTVLPDPDRKALTEEEMAALKTYGYDLEKLRVFTDVKEMFDIIRNAKAPLDGIDLKKVKTDLEILFGQKLTVSTTAASSSRTGAGDDEPTTDDETGDEDAAFAGADEEASTTKAAEKAKPAAAAEESEDEGDAEEAAAEKTKKSKETARESAAFSKPEADDEEGPEPQEPTTEDEGETEGEASDDDTKLSDMDCRGTHDPEDRGCQECTMVNGCKELKKTFKAKAVELAMDLKDYNSGAEIDVAIQKKEKELAAKAAAKPMGKVGKSGKSGTTEAAPAAEGEKKPARKLPF
jgi:hypothetical protein